MRIPFFTVIKCLAVVVILGGLFVAGYATYTRVPGILSEFKGRGPEVVGGSETIVTIPKGASLTQVGTILQDKGIIRSRLVFKLVALIRGEQRNVKAGDYILKTGSDSGDVRSVDFR